MKEPILVVLTEIHKDGKNTISVTVYRGAEKKQHEKD